MTREGHHEKASIFVKVAAKEQPDTIVAHAQCQIKAWAWGTSRRNLSSSFYLV